MQDAHAHHHHGHEQRPSSTASPSGTAALALRATLHCLTGCSIGEVLGMIIGPMVGLGMWETVAMSVVLAFVFGYAFTLVPLLKALPFREALLLALASDTLSIAIMEVVDNAIMMLIPGAMEAGPADVLFWGSMASALILAGLAAYPVNLWLLKRGKGAHAAH
jgi:hypothetical protein